MSRSRTSKDLDISEENLVGKSIVDPKGNIIAKCVGLFEDDKKKLHMCIAIFTDINSEFIVNETIPVSNINKIGEVILLKKAVKIEQVAVEDIVSFDILDEQLELEDKSELETKVKEKKQVTEKPKDANPIKSDEKYLHTATKSQAAKESELRSKTETVAWQFVSAFDEIRTSENGILPEKIKKFLANMNRKASRRKAVLKSLLEKMSESETETRLTAAKILVGAAESNPIHLIPCFIKCLRSIYSEPNKEVENLLIKCLNRVVSQNSKNLAKLKLEPFFDKLIIKRSICKSITLNRIHSINLKIFVNNFDAQEIIINKYLTQIAKNKKKTDEFAVILKDYNAILIAYSLIRTFNQNKWDAFLNSESIIHAFNEPFRNSIKRVIQNFIDGNIKALSEIMDPKLGFNYSNKIITNMIKFRLDDFLSNVTMLPMDVLTSFFQDDQKRAIQIIFDLINKNEIKAQIVFIEDKTYIASRDG
jgi:hypothetical protein